MKRIDFTPRGAWPRWLLACTVFALLGAMAAQTAVAQSSWDRRATSDSRQRIDQARERQVQYDDDGTVRRVDGRNANPGYNYPGYFSFYGWYGEIDAVDNQGENAWGGGFRWAWPGQFRMMMSIDGGTFTHSNFLDAQFARLFPLGFEADLYVPFSDDFGISFVAGVQAGMSMINYDQKVIKVIQIFAGFEGFAGLRIHLGPVFLGADFMVGPQFYLHQWDYDEDEDATLPPDPPITNRIWIGGTFFLGITFR